jgi:hypothetical protein
MNLPGDREIRIHTPRPRHRRPTTFHVNIDI